MIPWGRERLPTPVFWPGEFHGLYSPWGHKELDANERLSLSDEKIQTAAHREEKAGWKEVQKRAKGPVGPGEKTGMQTWSLRGSGKRGGAGQHLKGPGWHLTAEIRDSVPKTRRSQSQGKVNIPLFLKSVETEEWRLFFSLKSLIIFIKHLCKSIHLSFLLDFPDGSVSQESACSIGKPGSIPRLGRSPGEGDGYPLQYSCLENSTDRRAWRATVHGITESQTRLSDVHFQAFYRNITLNITHTYNEISNIL